MSGKPNDSSNKPSPQQYFANMANSEPPQSEGAHSGTSFNQDEEIKEPYMKKLFDMMANLNMQMR